MIISNKKGFYQVHDKEERQTDKERIRLFGAVDPVRVLTLQNLPLLAYLASCLLLPKNVPGADLRLSELPGFMKGEKGERWTKREKGIVRKDAWKLRTKRKRC